MEVVFIFGIYLIISKNPLFYKGAKFRYSKGFPRILTQIGFYELKYADSFLWVYA